MMVAILLTRVRLTAMRWLRRPRSRQMGGEVFADLEHRHLVGVEDQAELVVGEDFAAVLRVLQIVRADVFPDLADHLAARQLVREGRFTRAPQFCGSPARSARRG
jgi:hypothetical protein